VSTRRRASLATVATTPAHGPDLRTLAVLPVKSFGAAKQRLSGMLGQGSRQALAQAMFSDVLASLRHVPGIDAVAVVTADRVAETAALGDGVLVLRDTVEGGQSPAASIGVEYAVAAGFERVLLVPGDTPMLAAAEVAELLRDAERRELAVVVVPDRHGTGTNALLLSPPNAIAPSFGPGSFERHMASAADLPHAAADVPSLAFDVDTPDDLAELAASLEGRRGQAPLTRGALRQLDRSRARGPDAVAARASA
jgi:2-phospho-L-lactate guanylyltransferase